MATLVVADALQVTISGQNQGTPWANVYGLKVDSTFLLDITVADEIAEVFRQFHLGLSASQSTAFVADECYVNDLRSETAPSFEPVFAPVDGTLSGDAMPPQMSIVASHSTGFAGKSYRGRTYLAGWTEAANGAGGVVGSAYETLIEAEFAQLRADLGTEVTNGAELGVISRRLLEVNAVLATTVDEEWDRQNRRKRS